MQTYEIQDCYSTHHAKNPEKLDALTLVIHSHHYKHSYPRSRKFLCRIVKYRYVFMYLQYK